MEQLYLTRARQRGMFSAGDGFGISGMLREASRFARDIPPEHIESIGADFVSNTSSIGYEPVEDEDEYIPQYSRSKNLSAKKSYAATAAKLMHFPSRSSAKSILKTADQLGTEKPHKDWAAAAAAVTLEQLTTGLNVVHPTFGRGTIDSIEGDIENNPGKIKVGVRFADSDELRKLVFKYAKLSIA